MHNAGGFMVDNAYFPLPSWLKKEYPFDSHFFDSGKNHIHYLDEGKGHPIILVHGNPSWSFFYRHLVVLLRKNFRVIVPDHMGAGLSERPSPYPYTLSSHIKNLNDLINSLDIKEFSLVVHDWGGPIGFGVATHNIPKLKSLVILNTAAFFDDNLPKRIKICRFPFLGEWFMRSPVGFAYLASKMAVRKTLPLSIRKGYLFPYNNYRNRIGNARFVQDIPLNNENKSFPVLQKIQDKLSLITCPKLIVWGGSDFCFHEHFYKRFLAIYPQAEHKYFPNAGHYLLEDEREEIMPLIDEFLRRKS